MDNFTQDILFQSSAENSKFAQFKQLYPNCFNKNGEFLTDKFNELIQSQNIPTAQESYSLQWLGKSYAKALEKMPSETLLAEDITHNAKPENADSQNLLIKGDNLEVLKHLKHAYAEKVKMIYIDPPYNTGSDGFVYQDDRKFTAEQLAALGNMDIEAAQRVLDFTAKKSNSHSAWLTFMYPRLYIARELLRDDGVIFISIDDNEVAQLKILCDEVFGEKSFRNTLTVRRRVKSLNSQFSDKGLNSLNIGSESILVYAKSDNFLITPIYREKENTSTTGRWDVFWSNADRPTMRYDVLGFTPSTGQWRYSQDKAMKAVENYQKFLDEYSHKYTLEEYWKETGETLAFIRRIENGVGKNGGVQHWVPPSDTALRTSVWMDVEVSQIHKEIDVPFINPKNKNLILELIKLAGNNPNDIVLDFFAGSGTTGHAVMQLNTMDNGSRQFILVQLPEDLDIAYQKAGVETKKNIKDMLNFLDDINKPHLLSEITQARLEKSAVKIREEFPDCQADLGFKIFATVPDFRPPIADDAQTELYPTRQFSDGEIHTLLTTWRLYDGQALTDTVQSVSLDGYMAYLCGETLYLLDGSLDSVHIKVLIEMLDDTADHRDFAPKRIVLHGDLIASSKQKELAQAVQTYANKKDIRISLIARV